MLRDAIWGLALDAITTHARECGLRIEFTQNRADEELGWWMQLGESPEARRFYPDSYWRASTPFAELADRRQRSVETWIDEVAAYAALAEQGDDDG